MNHKHRTALATITLLAISGVAAGAAQADTYLPLSPASQENAVRKAQDFLREDNFSHKGLVEQLEYDHFSADDAEYAVSSIPVDWNEQAAGKAKSFLNEDAFSHEGLFEQLEYDGFTASQAEYGVTAAGL
jgi:Host cell surface-exposed lipoprotein